MHFHHDPNLRPEEIQPPTRHQLNHVERFLTRRTIRMLLRRTLRQAGTMLVYSAAFAVIILYGTYLASPWLQVAAH
jgi:hypothetical protein